MYLEVILYEEVLRVVAMIVSRFLKLIIVFEPFMQLENFKRVHLDDCNSVAWDIDPNMDSNVVWSNKVDLYPDACYMDSVPMTVMLG